MSHLKKLGIFFTLLTLQCHVYGSELLCPEGTSSENGFSPGCKFDPCLPINHQELNDWKRSTRYSNTSVLCDNFLQAGWYRPVSPVGNAMPTECQQNGFKCGTSNPIWMNGAHPSVGKTKNVTACVAGFNGDCCNDAYKIQVKNCADFYVYNLVPTTVCYQAYCFENKSKCSVSQTSNNGGFTPGCEYIEEKEGNLPITISIVLIAPLCVVLIVVWAIMCYKKKTAPKRAVSFLQFGDNRPKSPLPDYDDATKPNKYNHTEQQRKCTLPNDPNDSNVVESQPTYTTR